MFEYLSRNICLATLVLYRYNPTVFFAPSWEAIFSNDEDRKLSFSQAQEFGYNLKLAYQAQGYQLIELPLLSPEERADFICNYLEKEF